MQLTDTRGNPKYPALTAVVKMTLSLSHGQADVERGFSINKQVLDDRTTLSERVLCATRTVRKVINRYGSIMNIPITPSLLSACRSSHRKYTDALENEKAKTANQSVLGKRKLPLEDERDHITQTENIEWEQKQHQAEKLICEGTERITAALKAGKMTDVLQPKLCWSLEINY
jgi:hypothetical protein